MPLIKPTIGRVVLYQPHHPDDAPHRDQPVPALVCYVHDDRLINIGGFEADGATFAEQRVPLLQEDDDPPVHGRFAYWMDYQKAQAAKQVVLTEADAAADLAGTPRPDHPTVGIAATAADVRAAHAAAAEGSDVSQLAGT